MQQDLQLQKNKIIGAVVIVVVLIAGYFWYSSQSDSQEGSTTTVDKTLFSKDVASFYAVKDSINFKDLSFMKKGFYTKLRDDTVNIPSIKPTGRPNPFVPYVTP